MRNLFLALFLALPLCFSASAQDSLAISQPDTAAASIAGTQADDAPVAVPPASEQALRYYHSGNILWLAMTLWGFALPLIFLFTGLSALLRDWFQRVSKRKFILIFIYVIMFLLISFVIELPIEYYTGFARPHSYGLSEQTFGKWLSDGFKSLAVGIILGGLFVNLLYLVLRKSPRRWWFYFGLLTIPIAFFMLIITPVFIEPLFNDFGPMKDKALETKILALAERAGIGGSRVYEVNKSVDTKTLNAYVNGFANTKRIVLWDNTIKKMDANELLSVMGHEMGHYVLRHIIKSVLFISVVLMLTFFLAWKTAEWFIRKFGSRIGFSELSDVASLPLITFLLALYGFMLSPVTNTFSRYLEHEADVFGLEITKNNHAAASAFVKLQTENLSNPRPSAIIRFFRADHPTLGERIDFCNTYMPWKKGEKMKFDSYFKEERNLP